MRSSRNKWTPVGLQRGPGPQLAALQIAFSLHSLPLPNSNLKFPCQCPCCGLHVTSAAQPPCSGLGLGLTQSPSPQDAGPSELCTLLPHRPAPAHLCLCSLPPPVGPSA